MTSGARCVAVAKCATRTPLATGTHAIGYWDKSGVQGSCRDANIRLDLERLDILEQVTGSILARAQDAGNASGELDARELLDKIDGDRDRMRGTQDL